jgi:hypothetical protein
MSAKDRFLKPLRPVNASEQANASRNFYVIQEFVGTHRFKNSFVSLTVLKNFRLGAA